MPDFPLPSPFPVEHQHISVHRVLKDLGVPLPGRCWQKLQQHGEVHLPPHTLRQFAMRDGRKGKRIPAVHMRHQQGFMHALQTAALVTPPIGELFPQERRFVQQLQQATLSFQPQVLWRKGPWQFDVHFPAAQLVVQCRRTCLGLHTQPSLDTLLSPLGLRGMLLDPSEEDFQAEGWVSVLLQQLQNPGASGPLDAPT